jgi:hypothetical protein
MRKHITVVMTAILVLALATAAMAADDPFVGTWILNVAKSRFQPGRELRSEIIKAEAQDNGAKQVIDIVTADGKSIHIEWAAKYDGRDYPGSGNGGADTIRLIRIDTNTREQVVKKGGKEFATERIAISKDGKTRTTTLKGKDSKGQEFSSILIFEKK